MRRLTPLPGSTPPLSLADALAATAAPAVVDNQADERDLARREREALFADVRRDAAAKGLADAEAEIGRRTDAISARLQAEHALALSALRERMDAMSQLAAALSEAVGRHRRECEEAAIEAAYAALLQVLGDKAEDRSLMPTLCAHILRTRGAGPLTLRLSPADCALVEPAEDVRLVPDVTLASGRCIVESARGGSDTGLDVRLEALKNAFLEALTLHRERS
jgi:flagellar assembly protein FliH